MQIFSETIAEILAAPPTVGSVDEETRSNTRWLSISSAATTNLTENQVAAFLEDARRALKSVAPEGTATSLTFYAWVDEQAGQLRFSVSSAESLPFGSAIQETTDVRVIAKQLLDSPYVDGIPSAELEDTANGTVEEPTTTALMPLSVYAVPLIDY